MTTHGVALIYKVNQTITGVTGSAQSSDWNGKSTFEPYQGSDGEYNASSMFGFCQEFTHNSFPITAMLSSSLGTLVTVADPDGNCPFLVGSNWQVIDLQFKPTNKGPMQQVVKLWRAPGITS